MMNGQKETLPGKIGNRKNMTNADTIWSNRPVLVTGGAGFIGSWLAHGLIEARANVFILDIKKQLPEVGEH